MSCAKPEPPASAKQLELLRQHCPCLQYSQDPFRICSARTMVDVERNALHRADGSVLAARDGLSLEALSPEASPEEYLDEVSLQEHLDRARAEHPEPEPPALQDDPAYEGTVYGRVVDDGRGGRWLQYWFWLYYNQKRLLGFGAHQGDWEMIQIHLGRNGKPNRATFAQHASGEARRWGRGMVFDGSDGQERIVVFVAPFSHASYYEAGTKFSAGGTDSPDELGPRVLPEVEPFAGWAAWPGHWGGSHGFRRNRRVSPPSPGCQGVKWWSPDRFHQISLGLKWWQKALKGVWAAGFLTYPRTPLITGARIEGDVVRGQVKKSGWFRRGRHLYLTAHAPDDRRLVGGPCVAKNVRAAHQFEIELRTPVDRCLVHATAYNAWRQTSYPGNGEAARGAAAGVPR